MHNTCRIKFKFRTYRGRNGPVNVEEELTANIKTSPNGTEYVEVEYPIHWKDPLDNVVNGIKDAVKAQHPDKPLAIRLKIDRTTNSVQVVGSEARMVYGKEATITKIATDYAHFGDNNFVGYVILLFK